MKTVRLTMAQALVRHLAALRVEEADGSLHPYCGGAFVIFGHGNVAGLGEALHAERAALPTFRAHNEQGMAFAAVAYAKAHFRRRILAVSTSIGPGATNLITAAAVAHVDRLPVLLLPSDTFASRQPDPVLQQVEDFQQGDVTASDCFRPVSRYFDRITRPEQILTALPRAIQVMTDPAMCGPVTLSLPQDVQAMAFDCPESFLHPEPIRFRRPPPDADELARAVKLLAAARKPLIVAGGGVLYSQAGAALRAFAEKHGVPIAESHGGKSCVSWDMPLNLGGIGVDGGAAANDIARDADFVFAVGTRLQDFTTGSHALFSGAKLLSLNVQRFDAGKWSGAMLVADAQLGLKQMSAGLAGWQADAAWTARSIETAARWNARVTELTTNVPNVSPPGRGAPAPQGGAQPPSGGRASSADVLPYDAEVIGAVRDSHADSAARDIVVCAAGTLPAELHKLWRASRPGGYHVEYGYSCMGYEIAGALGVKMAQPDAEVIVMVGDGSYMMLNAELATSVLLGQKIIVVVLDNRGYGCIQRLQQATGNASFNNMLDDCVPEGGARSTIDFAMNARSMGAHAVHVGSVAELKTAMVAARAASTTQVIVIDTTHERITAEGGCWWQVGVPEVSDRPEVLAAHDRWREAQRNQRL